MSKLIVALIAGAFAAAGAAQTGTVNPGTVADHGTPAMHAQETAKNVAASKQVKGLTDDKSRRQAVKDTTKIADHGTQVLHAEDAAKNLATSRAESKPIAGSKAGQDAIQQATKGATK